MNERTKLNMLNILLICHPFTQPLNPPAPLTLDTNVYINHQEISNKFLQLIVFFVAKKGKSINDDYERSDKNILNNCLQFNFFSISSIVLC